ncbi:MAG: DoxX family protein [Bacteroidetes bacterium]|nr:DoxX family protein [Bacteroidota bacterium]
MKTTKIIYWTTTILFAAFMTFSAIPDILMADDAIKFMIHLNYPVYFIPFIGVAKLLGAVAILIPAFKKIKEWAYAGLFFDLIGAVYSIIMIDGFQPGMLVMVVIFGIAITSYIYNQKYHADSTA